MSEEAATYNVPTPPPAAPAPTVLYVYAGTRRDSKNKPRFLYFELEEKDAEPTGAGASFYSKKLFPASVGSLIRFESTASGVLSSTAKYEGRFTRQNFIDRWAVEDARDKGLIELARKSKVDNRLAELLAPVAHVYSRTNPQGRAALLTKIILTIQRMPVEAE